MKGKIKLLLLWFGLLHGITPFAQTAPDLVSLIKDCQANGQNSFLLNEYTYNWKVTQRGNDKKGIFRDEFALYETYIPTFKNKGTTKFVLIQTHDKSQPLPSEQVEKERQKAGDKLVKADTENQRANVKETLSVEDQQRRNLPGIYFIANVSYGFTKSIKLSLQTILNQCVFENQRVDVLNNRPVIKLDYHPLATAVLDKEEKFLTHSHGTIWVDKVDRLVIKVEGTQRNANTKDDSVMFSYQSLRTPEGKWLPERVQFLGNKNKAFFQGMGGDMIFEWLDYKRFITDAEDEKIKTPK